MQNISAVRRVGAIRTCLARTELGQVVIDHPGKGLWAHNNGIRDAFFASQMDTVIPNITKIDKYYRFESRKSTNHASVVLHSPPSCYISVNRYKRGTFELFLPFVGLKRT